MEYEITYVEGVDENGRRCWDIVELRDEPDSQDRQYIRVDRVYSARLCAAWMDGYNFTLERTAWQRIKLKRAFTEERANDLSSSGVEGSDTVDSTVER